MANNAEAQQYRQYSFADRQDFANSFVKYITQDSTGLIWLATDQGVVLYDGYNFTYKNKGLNSLYTKMVLCDRNNNLWVAADMGTLRYNRQTDSLELIHPSIGRYLFLDDQNNIWSGGAYSKTQIIQIKPSGITTSYQITDTTVFADYYRGITITDDGYGHILAFTTGQQIFVLDSIKNQFVQIPHIAFPSVQWVKKHAAGKLLIATRQGLFYLQLRADLSIQNIQTYYPTNHFMHIERVAPNQYLLLQIDGYMLQCNISNDSLYFNPVMKQKNYAAIFVDKNKDIWIAGDAGLDLYKPSIWHTISTTADKRIRHLASDKTGVVCSIFNKIYRLSFQNNQIDTTLLYLGVKDERINSVVNTEQGLIYNNSNGELVMVQQGKNKRIRLPSGKAKSQFFTRDSSGNFWIEKENINGIIRIDKQGKVHNYDDKHGIWSRISVVCVNKQGQVLAWSGSDTSYLYRYNPATDRFENISPKFPFDLLRNIWVMSLAQTAGGGIYAATDFGLFLYQNNQLQQIDLKQHTNKQAKALCFDADSALWIGCEDALLRYKNNDFTLFDPWLKINNLLPNTIIIDNNNLWFASTSKVYHHTISATKPSASPSLLMALFDGKSQSFFEKIYTGMYAKISFISPSFPNNEIRFRYRLIQKDTNWSEATLNNVYELSLNQSGNYTIQVQALQAGNYDWSPTYTYQLYVHKKWYNTWWAYGMYVLALSLIIWIGITLYNRRLIKQKQTLEAIVENRTKELYDKNQQLATANEDIVTKSNLLRLQHKEVQQAYTALEQQKQAVEQQKNELQRTLEHLQTTQKKLVEAEKMASLGNLVAGVAHEINTPVGVAITSISTVINDIKELVAKYEKGDMSATDFETYVQMFYDGNALALKNLERTADLVRSFKQISLDQHTEQERKFNLNDYLHDLLASIRPEFKHTQIKIAIDCPPDLNITSYPGAYAQIFTNLLTNSKRHGFRNRDQGQINVVVKRENDKLHITYTDNGHGIPAHVLPRIFDPFFTTDMQSGTGLGLNIVYNLVNQKLGGEIRCESTEGMGVKFLMVV